MYLIETRLTKLMALEGCETYSEFYERLRRSQDPNLRDKIVDAITTNETFWVRDTTRSRSAGNHAAGDGSGAAAERGQ